MLAVHVQHPARSAQFVQVVDVLGDDQQVALPFGIELTEREMRRVRLLLAHLAATHVVEREQPTWIAGKGLCAGDLGGIVFLPEATGGAESVDPAFGADPRAGQDHDVADVLHAAFLTVTLNLFQGPFLRIGSHLWVNMDAETSSA